MYMYMYVCTVVKFINYECTHLGLFSMEHYCTSTVQCTCNYCSFTFIIGARTKQLVK